MQSQQQTYSVPDQNDFSSALMHATAAEKKSPVDQFGKAAAGKGFDAYDPYNNRNLSSILSRITDEGPANLHSNDEPGRSRNRHLYNVGDSMKEPDASYSAAVSSNLSNTELLPQSISFDETGISGETEQTHKNRYSRWHQLVLLALIAMTAVIGFLLYQLTLKTELISYALSLNEEQIVLAGSVQQQPSEVIPRLVRLNEVLAEMKEELQGIKADQQRNERLLDSNKTTELGPQLKQIAATSEQVRALKKEFEHIQKDMHQMETEFKVIKTEIKPKQTMQASQQTKPKQIQKSPDQLVVNLASFTSRGKAEAATDVLQQAGVTPLIEEVIVNKQKVYRISVDGFSTRDAASAFITEANQRYGFDGGWIRQN